MNKGRKADERQRKKKPEQAIGDSRPRTVGKTKTTHHIGKSKQKTGEIVRGLGQAQTHAGSQRLRDEGLRFREGITGDVAKRGKLVPSSGEEIKKPKIPWIKDRKNTKRHIELARKLAELLGQRRGRSPAGEEGKGETKSLLLRTKKQGMG